ncbi:hypothetical protein ACS0TY_013969 [Phlomoides rotata]
MVATKPHPSVFDFTKLLVALVKMKQHSVALHLFVRMLERDAPVNIYTCNIAIDCFCTVNHVDFAFVILGSLVKRDYIYGRGIFFLSFYIFDLQKCPPMLQRRWQGLVKVFLLKSPSLQNYYHESITCRSIGTR